MNRLDDRLAIYVLGAALVALWVIAIVLANR